MAANHQIVTVTFWCKFDFRKCFEASEATELAVSGCLLKSSFCLMSLSDQEMVCCCYTEKEKMTLQNDKVFCFAVSS